MSKKAILLIFLGVIMLSLAASNDSGVIEYKYYFIRVVANTISDMYFTDTGKNRITSLAVDMEKNLSHPQVYAAIYANMDSSHPYTITITFFPLVLKSTPGSTFKGGYQAKVYRLVNDEFAAIDNNDDSGTVTVVDDTTHGYSVSFTGDNTSSSDISATFYYPIAFNFGSSIDTYSTGTYEDSVVIEVAT